jgi:hypothetical protein
MDQYSRKSEFPDSVWWKHLTENFNGICETLLLIYAKVQLCKLASLWINIAVNWICLAKSSGSLLH